VRIGFVGNSLRTGTRLAIGFGLSDLLNQGTY
jgi:hypothetical protein